MQVQLRTVMHGLDKDLVEYSYQIFFAVVLRALCSTAFMPVWEYTPVTILMMLECLALVSFLRYCKVTLLSLSAYVRVTVVVVCVCGCVCVCICVSVCVFVTALG